MFERISDRWKTDARGALLLVVIAAAALVTATVTVSFLCAAAFVVAFDRYGLVEACLAGAGVFLAATMALLGTYAIHAARRRRDAEARAASEPPPLSALADPRVIMVGLQIVQAIGVKRLLPILAVAGAAFALASRPASKGDAAAPKPAGANRRQFRSTGAAKAKSARQAREEGKGRRRLLFIRWRCPVAVRRPAAALRSRSRTGFPHLRRSMRPSSIDRSPSIGASHRRLKRRGRPAGNRLAAN